MAFIQARTSRGKKYWSIVECRRVNGKPHSFILEYLGTATTLLQRLQAGISIKSYSHGDTAALLNAAIDLDIVNIINKHVPVTKSGTKPMRDGLTVGASFVLAAIGRACNPTSKRGWYAWCQETSLEYCLKLGSLKKLDSQHFWDQMAALPAKAIPAIEEELVTKLVKDNKIGLDCLFYDTTNFFTFIDTTNKHCDLPQRGRNKQKRLDLRQIGLALLVSREDQFPLFHQTYRGDKNDITIFKETCGKLLKRLRRVAKELSDVTIVFDKGNNSQENFSQLDEAAGCYYVAGLVVSYFKDLVKEANENFTEVEIEGETLPVYRTKRLIWGQERTCVITVSSQLKEGQIKGIEQHLEQKSKKLSQLKQQLDTSKSKKKISRIMLERRLNEIIQGQFIKDILKYEIIELGNGKFSFTYFWDYEAFDKLKAQVLGRQIVVTNRHDWDDKDILLAYRGQSKVEYAFRNLKNPCHMAIRPQYHWTDQKIEAHILMCIIGYLLTVYTYRKVKGHYEKNISNFMNGLKNIRLACVTKKRNKISYQLEKIRPPWQPIAKILKISNENIRQKLNFSSYN